MNLYPPKNTNIAMENHHVFFRRYIFIYGLIVQQGDLRGRTVPCLIWREITSNSLAASQKGFSSLAMICYDNIYIYIHIITSLF